MKTLLIILSSLVLTSVANAASLKVCYSNVTADVSDVNLYIGAVKVVDVFPGQTQGDGSICATISPLPVAVQRGTVQSYTLKAVNSIDEEGPASNALSFRYPAIPGAPTFVSVGASIP